MSIVKKAKKEASESETQVQAPEMSDAVREQLVAILERLEAIERKIDTTLNDLRQARQQQPQARPFNNHQGGGFRPFSQPNRRPGHFSNHPGNKHQGHSYNKPYFGQGQGPRREHRGGGNFSQHSHRPSQHGHSHGGHPQDNAGNR